MSMKSLSPVVWFEGMHLSPHQFQAQRRYFEDSIRFATSALWFENYGLIGSELSAEALENGQALLVHARGIFPDGLAFDMPDSDPVPEPLDIAGAFPPAQNKAVLLLAVPPERSGARNYSLELATGVNGTRFAAEQRVLVDENNGSDERAVRVGRKNIRLMLDTEDPQDTICLPVARIMRSGSGRFVLDPSYIPPCLDITAASRLLPMLGRLVRSLDDRAASLRSTLTDARGTSPRELTRFWFLHTLNAAVAPLRHIYNARRGHPEQLYLEMSRLAGALCTFLLESHPRGLPLYDHRNLEACFDALDAHIRRHIEIVIQENCLRIPLPQTAQYFFGAEITDPRCLGSSSWILSVRGGGPEVEVISKVPGLVKVCSEAFVPELVKRALPGFVLTHLPSPPPAVPATPDAQYFQINRAGPCWEHIRTSKRVGAYVPGDLPNPELELLVVIE